MIIFALAKWGQRLTGNGKFGAARGFSGVAVIDFGKTRNDAVAGAQRFQRQRATVEALVRLDAVDIVGKQFEAHLARHAVRADDDG